MESDLLRWLIFWWVLMVSLMMQWLWTYCTSWGGGGFKKNDLGNRSYLYQCRWYVTRVTPWKKRYFCLTVKNITGLIPIGWSFCRYLFCMYYPVSSSVCVCVLLSKSSLWGIFFSMCRYCRSHASPWVYTFLRYTTCVLCSVFSNMLELETIRCKIWRAVVSQGSTQTRLWWNYTAGRL